MTNSNREVYENKEMTKQIIDNQEGFIHRQIYEQLVNHIKQMNSLDEQGIFNMLNKLECHVTDHIDAFNSSRSSSTKNFKVAIIVFTSNFIKYSPNQVELNETINSIINDANARKENDSTNFDYRPKYEKINLIEDLSINIVKRVVSSVNDDISNDSNLKDLSESLSKHFYDDTEQKELFNLYDYFNNCFKIDNRMYTNSFLNLLKYIKFPHVNDFLIALSIKLCLKLIESFTLNFDDKLFGLELINCLINNTSKSDLIANNRSLLLLNNFERFMYDKDSHEFTYKLHVTQLKLLDIHESQYSSSEHEYSLHSKYFNILLNNCLMCSNLNVKIIYLLVLKKFLEQMHHYAVKYLTKLFDVLLVDTVDYMRANIDYKFNYILIKLIFSIIESCCIKFQQRIHQHAKVILNFLVKFIYYMCLDYCAEDEVFDVKRFENYDKVLFEEESCLNDHRYYCLNYCLKLIIFLFKNEKIRRSEYKSFSELNLIDNNKIFEMTIQFIFKEIDNLKT